MLRWIIYKISSRILISSKNRKLFIWRCSEKNYDNTTKQAFQVEINNYLKIYFK